MFNIKDSRANAHICISTHVYDYMHIQNVLTSAAFGFHASLVGFPEKEVGLLSRSASGKQATGIRYPTLRL